MGSPTFPPTSGGGSGEGVTDHGALTGLEDDDHTQYIKHSLATAVSDFLVASGSGAFVKKTLAEVKTILGLGGAAYLSVGTISGTVAAGDDSRFGTGGSGITWNEVTGTSQAATVDTGYICNNSALVTVTLPSTCAVGKIIRVAGKGAGKWKIAQNASQIIYFGDQNTTSGTAGYLAAQNRYDAVELLCITADTTFLVIAPVGNLTVV